MGASNIHRYEAAHERASALARQTEELRHRQAGALAQLDCLATLAFEHLRRLAGITTMRTFIPGAVLIDEREPSEFLFLILRGTICLRLHDRAGHEALIGFLGRGDCFGEGPLFGDRFRNASAEAETICYVLQIPIDDLRPLVAEIPELYNTLHRFYHDRLVASTLGRVPLFSQLTPLTRSEIADMLVPRHHARGELIIREGAPGDALYLIESGQVVVEAAKRAIAHLDEGDFFGEMSLFTEQPHNADVRAVTPTDLLVLPAEVFQRLLQMQPALAEQVRTIVDQRRSTGSAMRSDELRAREFTSALGRGLLRGRHVLVHDPELCQEGCRLCQNACTTRHGRSRLHLNGVMFNGLEITESCRQCRVGAECVEVCPENAIVWDERSALVINNKCTGCGECVSACPYDAIELVPVTRRPLSPLWALYERFKKLRNPIIPLEQTAPTQRADKCDLCHGFDTLACVQACPTGALKLIPVEEIVTL